MENGDFMNDTYITPRVYDEWKMAISCNGTKLIAPTASGDFEISLIY